MQNSIAMKTKMNLNHLLISAAISILSIFLLQYFVVKKRNKITSAEFAVATANPDTVFAVDIKEVEPLNNQKLSVHWQDYAEPLEEINEKYIPKKSVYYADADKDIVIITKNKIKLKIPYNALNTDTTSKKKVRVEIVEYLNINQMFFSGLTTVSDGKLLVSAGMFNIDCFQGNRKLELKKGKFAEISVLKEIPESYYIFNASQDSTPLNWQLAKTQKRKKRKYSFNTHSFDASIKLTKFTIHIPQKNPYEIFVSKNDSLVPFCRYFEENFTVSKSMYQFSQKTDYQLHYTFTLDTVNKKISFLKPSRMNKAEFHEKYINAFINELPPLVFVKNKDAASKKTLNHYKMIITSDVKKYPALGEEKEEGSASFADPFMKKVIAEQLSNQTDTEFLKKNYSAQMEDEQDETTFIIDKLGCINIDQFYNLRTPKCRIAVVAPQESVEIYLVMKSLNSIIGATSINFGNFQFSEIPSSKDYVVVMRKIIGDKILHLVKEITPTNDMIIKTEDFVPVKAAVLSSMIKSPAGLRFRKTQSRSFKILIGF